MDKPPFAAASIASIFPAQSPSVPEPPAAMTAPKRMRLDDLNQHFHCSIIGTCMSTAAMRKLMRRLDATYAPQDSDLDVHHAAVSTAMNGGVGAKALTKALDEQHLATIRRFAAATTTEELAELWSTALKIGEVPGAYWAVMTHPATGTALRQRIFGDVHMLSHLVGAANRADIRRLVALGQENAELHAQVDVLQARITHLSTERDCQLATLQGELAEARGQVARLKQAQGRARPAPGSPDAAHADLVGRLERESRLRQQAEAAAASKMGALVDAEGRLARSTDAIAALQHEVRALEVELATAAQPTSDFAGAETGRSPLDARLSGLRLLYVGGRPSTLTAIRQIVERAGGEWLHHDGGMEDRKGLLAAMLPRAHVVVFPVDCIDHDSMQQLKKLCARHELAYRPLRTASVASFVGAMSTADESEPLANGAALASRFCVRHG